MCTHYEVYFDKENKSELKLFIAEKTYLTVHEIRMDKIYFLPRITNDLETSLFMPSLYMNIEPIPLTEEWLSKFGFENAFADKWDGMEWMPCEFINGKLYYTPDMHHHASKGIENVHQLQNLYFALTGEELTIKETA